MNPALIRDPLYFERFHGRNHAIVPILPDGDGEPLEAALAAHGVGLTDITRIYLSHLHNDHAGGLRLFAARVPVHVQRAELDYGLGDHPFPEQHGMFRIDYDDPAIDWHLLDGDTEIAPGITALLTPGHTPGHQSFVVTLDDDLAERAGVPGYVLAFDAADLQENIDDELAVGGFIDCPPEQTVEAIRRLKAIAAERGYRVIPGHDPVVWPAFSARHR
jgi:glyoxylase-like metal-dependent hydrolase (beta-lactamase superfamily II)